MVLRDGLALVRAVALPEVGRLAEVLGLALRVVRVDHRAGVVRRAARRARKALAAALVVLLVRAVAGGDRVEERRRRRR